jgi:hypothetical protein
MRDLGLYYDSRGNHDAARRMMNAAFAASRRDSSVNLWLTQDLARRGQGLAALQLYDITIRTDTSAAASLMTLMAQALQRPGAVSAFEQVLAAKPPWLDDFWSAVLSAPGDLTPAFELRQRLHLRGVPMVQSHDALLIEKLANSGKLEEAFALYGSVAKPSSTDELLIDSGFDTQAPFPPIGWKVSAEGTFGAAIDTATGVLDITALPGAEGVVTQQLVRLGGSGNFAMKAIYDGTGQRTPLGLRVTCAEMDGEKTLDHMFDVPSGQTVMATFATPCRYAWISLILRRDDESAGRDIRVDSVSFRRVS